MNKPRYTDPAERLSSASLAAVPPFRMRNVTCRAFPLRADMAALTGFCDQYLNMDVPPAIAHFRPLLPFVYFLVLDYGSMSPESVALQNLGWVAQHEMLFMVPLEWWREEDGEMVFQDWACTSPFIFVDDAMSQRTGREVYGWPKVLGQINPSVPQWVNDPRAPVRLFTMSVKVFPKTYAGDRQEPRSLVEVYTEPRLRLSEVPLNATDPLGLLSMIERAGASAVGLTNIAAEILLSQGLRSVRNPGGLWGMWSDLIARAAAVLQPSAPAGETEPSFLSIQQITLKQFRDVADPISACYQALVRSPMGLDRVNAAGLLGDTALLRGDASGGFSVHIHRYNSQPIIESLGLEVHEEREDTDGSTVAVLKPVLPFWTDVDLQYGAGTVICSRVPAPEKGAPICWHDEQDQGHDHVSTELRTTIPYNTARGAATQPISGPFHFPDMTLQVYPLLADPEKLQACVDRYLNDALTDTGFRFEVAGSYAYLIATLCGDEEGTMWSEVNDLGWWAEREVSFNIPVRWTKDGEFHSLALVAPFVFANSGRAVLTDREVNGRASVQAAIEADEDVWLTEPSGPAKPRRFLRVTTEVFPALNLGQQSEERTLLEIDEADVLPYNDMVGWRLVAESWGDTVAAELGRLTGARVDHDQALQHAKALATEILCGCQPVNWINLKQYRDTDDADCACYQSIVHTTWMLTDVYDIREIKNRLHVRLHRYPGEPIATTLGLQPKLTASSRGCVVQSFQPMRPFWMRIALRADLGQELCWRANDGPWQIPHPMFSGGYGTMLGGFFHQGGGTRTPRRLGNADVWRNELSPQRLHDSVDDAQRAALLADLAAIAETTAEDPAYAFLRPSPQDFARGRSTLELYQIVEQLLCDDLKLSASGQRLTHQEAHDAMLHVGEPQLILGSILTDQWSHWGDPAHDQPPPEIAIRADSVDWHEERRIWQRRHGLVESARGWLVLKAGAGTRR